MSHSQHSLIKQQGFSIVRSSFPLADLEILRKEADHLISQNQATCIRHIREKSTIFSKIATSPSLLSHLPQAMIPVRSILFDKTAEHNWPVAWHQDLTIAVKTKHELNGYSPWSHKEGHPHVQPPTALLERMLTLRLHLDPTPASNGALRVIPKSHTHGKISSSLISSFTEKTITCECQAGDILIMSPLILHSSNKSKLPNRRRILHFEYAPTDLLDERLEWLENEDL